MSTAISTTLKTVDYPALSADSRQSRIIAANLEGEMMEEKDLIRVPTPAGGGTVWSIDANGNVETTEEIIGLLVGVGKRGTLWPKEDPSEMRPVLSSHDLLVGYRTGDDLGDIAPADLEKYRIGDRRYDWVALSTGPEFGFGSGKNKAGKRVKEARVLAILRHGETWPILVTVGPGSLGNFLPFQKRLPAFSFECCIGLKLIKVKSASGATYSQIVPRLVGVISEEQGEIARRLYADPLRAMFALPPMGAAIVRDDE